VLIVPRMFKAWQNAFRKCRRPTKKICRSCADITCDRLSTWGSTLQYTIITTDFKLFELKNCHDINSCFYVGKARPWKVITENNTNGEWFALKNGKNEKNSQQVQISLKSVRKKCQMSAQNIGFKREKSFRGWKKMTEWEVKSTARAECRLS